MIQLTDVFCVLFRYTIGPDVSDYNKRLILSFVIRFTPRDPIKRQAQRNFSRREQNTVKPMYNDDPWGYKFVTVVGRWLLFRGSFESFKKQLYWDSKV
jgi:hypothetical protein